MDTQRDVGGWGNNMWLKRRKGWKPLSSWEGVGKLLEGFLVRGILGEKLSIICGGYLDPAFLQKQIEGRRKYRDVKMDYQRHISNKSKGGREGEVMDLGD